MDDLIIRPKTANIKFISTSNNRAWRTAWQAYNAASIDATQLRETYPYTEMCFQ